MFLFSSYFHSEQRKTPNECDLDLDKIGKRFWAFVYLPQCEHCQLRLTTPSPTVDGTGQQAPPVTTLDIDSPTVDHLRNLFLTPTTEMLNCFQQLTSVSM